MGDGKGEPDDRDKHEAGEDVVRGAASAPAREPAEREIRGVHRPGQDGDGHQRVESAPAIVQACDPDGDAERERG